MRRMLDRMVVAVVLATGAGVACGGQGRAEPPPAGAPKVEKARESGTGTGTGTGTTEREKEKGVVRPSGKMRLPEARRYMLALLNRDRATMGLAPVALDEGAAQKSGQRHAEDMAHHGFLGHWGTDGSVPEQRHTEAGGAHLVLENALCFTDGKVRALDPDARIDPEAIERAESQFFDEVPPNDGHRKNILRAAHTHVGIGIAQPLATATELPVPCVSQELVDAYGAYAPIPLSMKVGGRVRVEGSLAAGTKPTSVGLARMPLPKPLAPQDANKRRVYPVPPPYQTFWGPGFVSPIPLEIRGQSFAIEVPLDDKRQPGLYAISVWGQLAGDPKHVMLGLRTVRVD